MSGFTANLENKEIGGLSENRKVVTFLKENPRNYKGILVLRQENHEIF